jgi:purine-binding chemotaxis protein CheW
MSSLTSQSPVSQKKQAQAIAKLVTFPVGLLTLALPIGAVHKVVNLTPIHGSGIYPVGVTAIGEENYTVIDLHQKLFQTSPSRENPTAGYLILVQLPSGEKIGIPVTEAPSLIEVPLTQIRILPESYRRSDTLAIASHIVMLTGSETNQPIFILETQKLL